MSLRSLCEHLAHRRERQAEVLGDLGRRHARRKGSPHRFALPLLQHRRGLAGSQGSGVFCRSWIKPVKGQSGLLHRRLQLRSGSPALLHPALHFLYEPTQMLCQLGVDQLASAGGLAGTARSDGGVGMVRVYSNRSRVRGEDPLRGMQSIWAFGRPDPSRSGILGAAGGMR